MKDIVSLRERLDSVDAEMLRLFEERMELSKEIGRYKRVNRLPITDEEREREVLSSRLSGVPAEYAPGAERLVRLLTDESKRVQRRGLNIYLIGMPDCGKTRTGKKLKELIGMPLADTDKLIMRTTGKTIDEIFEAAGEESFRIIESAVLASVAQTGGMIAALGGGTPLYGNNAEVMRYSGVTVFLDRAPEKLLGQNTVNRPLLRGATPEETNERIMKLYKERRDRYAAAADLTVDPDAADAAETIAAFCHDKISEK